MYLKILVVLIALNPSSGQDRQITSSINPDCDTCSLTSSQLVYVKAVGSNDIIHQIWDFSAGVPTVIYAITELNTTLTISWIHCKPTYFHFDQALKYSFAAAIDQIYEYDDVADKGYYSGNSTKRITYLKEQNWTFNKTLFTDDEATLRMETPFIATEYNGTLAVTLKMLPFKDYATQLPHLIHTANSSLFDIELINFPNHFNSSRYALHIILMSLDSRNYSWNYTVNKSLDDEHTPGVFEIMEIKSPNCSQGHSGGYVQFRPVAYTERMRSVSSSTDSHLTNFYRALNPGLKTAGYFYRYFKTALLLQEMVISFGVPGDGFYKQHNFIAWSFSLGYGTPPTENFSLFVTLVLSIGLGVPVLLAVSGFIYILWRRFRERNPPTRLVEEN